MWTEDRKKVEQAIEEFRHLSQQLYVCYPPEAVRMDKAVANAYKRAIGILRRYFPDFPNEIGPSEFKEA